jgi:uncharacterized protein YqjF (DUF2071 family)
VARVFLTAEWRYLVMLNYRVPPELLLPLVPAGTELDSWRGSAYMSVVGFLFRDTRVIGVPVPFHRNFEEVNLRFYVRREVGSEVRRAVTFVKELVPRYAIATIARLTYNEPYQAIAMRHRLGAIDPATDAPSMVEYSWGEKERSSRVMVVPAGRATPLQPGSEEEFITEHFWGYTRQRDGSTIEYRVEHPSWNVWQAGEARLEGDLESVYGATMANALRQPPASAFVADGSKITVFAPTKVTS